MNFMYFSRASYAYIKFLSRAMGAGRIVKNFIFNMCTIYSYYDSGGKGPYFAYTGMSTTESSSSCLKTHELVHFNQLVLSGDVLKSITL